MKIKPCLYNSCCLLSVILGVILIAVEIFFLQGLTRAQAEEGIVMTNQTYGLWGIIPGDTQTFTIRNFTMFNFTNANDFIYKGSVTPSFVQVGNFLYQQKCQFINYFFSDDQDKINFDYWLYFDLLPESRNVQQKFSVINVAPLGFWMQLDSVPIATFTLQGFGGLFVQMNNTIKMQAIGQGVSGTFLKDYDSFIFICKQLAIDQKICWHLWNDRYYGLDNQVNLQFWVKAAYYQDQSTKQCLYEHFFPLPAVQFEGLLFQIRQLSQSINQVLENWYCKEGQKCDSYKFTLKQISEAGITNNPPPGNEATESICSSNQTCIGSPQISTFLHHQFKKMYPDSKYQLLKFSQQTIKTLFTPYQGLLNIGTLNEIYASGSAYDKTKEEKYLNQLNLIFKTETNDHSFVLWEWIKYMTNQFVLKLGRGGSRKIAGLGGVFTQALYEVSFSFANWFLQDTYSFLAYKKIGNNCKQILGFLGLSTSQKICQQLIPDPKNYTNFYALIQPCLNNTRFYSFQKEFHILPTTMQQYCDIDEEPSNVGLIAIQIMQIVKNRYNCQQSEPGKKCTQIDIAVKQIFNSEITRNPFEYKDYPYYNKSCSSVHTWNPQIPAFQYMHYLELSGIEDPQQHLQSEVRDLFSFDKLLNGPAVQQLFITDNDIDFYHKYHWVNPAYLRNYIRFVVLQVGFGGFTQQRSPKQVFFGYTDPFLQTLKETDTMAGGDPSIQSLIAFNELNLTKQQAKINKQVMSTGHKDTKKTRQYVSLFGKSHIVFNDTYFDGKDVKWQMKSPWAEDVQLQGSDGFSVPPNIDQSDTPPVYISSIARFANVKFKKTLQKYDMELWDMRIQQSALQSIDENPENAKYFQGIHSFLNSSYQGFPLFVSKNHFLSADQKWASLVRIVDQRGNLMKANQWDDTRLYIQPYTGTAFSATVFLQSNYYYQPHDILFPSSELFRNKPSNYSSHENNDVSNRMLPIVNTFRSGNISANAVDKYFGDLRDIIKNKRKVALTGWVLLALCFMTWIGVKLSQKFNIDKQAKEKENKSLLSENSANQ